MSANNNNHHFFYPRNVIENVVQNLDSLISATSVKSVLEHNQQIAKWLQYDSNHGIRNFFKLKGILNVKSLSKWNRVASILKSLDLKSNQKEYAARHKLQDKKILVIGGGISGLRAAIELLLIGAKVTCVEKRDEFSRNNVIHLWPNVINDMYTFEAKRFYGQFCVGSIDHFSIRQLQLLLLKIAIIYGLNFVPSVAFEEICPRIIEPNECKCDPETCNCCCHSHGFGGGAYAHFKSPHNPSLSKELNKESFDVIIGCDGRRNTFSRYFPRNNRRGKLAIGLTANYVNRRTEEEAHCPEISGISRIYNQKWFKDLQAETSIELENLVYYRDETHYFVMTATKASLLRRGVLRTDYGDSHALLSNNNIDISMLMKYSKDAAEWSSKLKRLEFALNSSNKPDVALFDFTSMYSATNASCAKKTYLKCCDENVRKTAKYTLMMLCGDSLLEPFWPTGSGAGRGFLSALDAAWTVAMWYGNIFDESTDIDAMLNVISRREYVYRLLAQTSPENTTPKNFSLDPQTRYKNLNLRDSKILHEIKNQVRHLIIDKNDLVAKNYTSSYEAKRARRATVGINPDDVLKAKNYQPLKAFDDFNEILPAFSNKPLFSVPSSNAKNPIYNCDNLPIEVIELMPKNPGSSSPQPSSPQPQSSPNQFDTHIDFKPRNNEPSSFNRRNYEARNHFMSSNLDELKPLGATSSGHQLHNKENYMRDSSNSKSLLSPMYKAMFGVDDLDSDPEDQSKYSPSGHTNYYGRNNSIQDRKDLLEPNKSRSNELDFAQNYRKLPAKSVDIVEKAQYLEQKLDDLHRPFVPTLAKVGKIEDEDWNVKIWNSTDIFDAKVPERKNMIHDNSKELLQSRIRQLNNNFSGSNYKDDLRKTVAKSRVTNEYVNLLSNEVSQKLAPTAKASDKGAEPLLSVQLLKANNSTDSDQADHFARRTTPNLKTAELLKPLGECRRCARPITAIDRVSVLGQSYHKTCLTCKACSIMLRQDEIASDDFICKICSKSRANTQSDARSSFFNNQLSVSLIEAKKNFLVNVEQIDLRERAEFEILDEFDDAKGPDSPDTSEQEQQQQPLPPPSLPPPPECSESDSSEAEILENHVEEEESPIEIESQEDISPLENNQLPNDANNCSSQSDLSESEPRSDSRSDTNYTDDEQSDSESGNIAERGKNDDFDSFLKPEPMLAEAPCESDQTELLSSNHNAFDNNVILNEHLSNGPNSDHCDPQLVKVIPSIDTDHSVPLPVEPQLKKETPPTNKAADDKPFVQKSFPAYLSMTQSYPNSDSSLVLDRLRDPNPPLIDRAFRSRPISDKMAVEKESRPVGPYGKTGQLPYRYSGQFTEKFYRTLSQPTLYEQLNLIDRKLKKSSALPPLSHEDLPFADSHEDLSSSQPVLGADLSQAPVADLEDV